MDLLAETSPSSSSSPQSTPNNRSSSYNPYQRMASRRAIACVTCAKAKTKCDKGLPSCSRCISKGIKCDPRSTRRTSDNSYRANIRKPFVPPKRYRSGSDMSSSSRHTSPRNIASSKKPRVMRAASQIDFRTAVKMSQQSAACPGLSMLTPLPTYNSQIMDECYSYSGLPGQDMAIYTPLKEYSVMQTSGRLTPQTPESDPYHETLAIEDNPSAWMAPQSWSDDSLAPIGLDLQGDMTALLPSELWSTHDYSHSVPITQMAWGHTLLSTSPHSVASDLTSHTGTSSSLSISECSIDDFNAAGAFTGDWTTCQPTPTQFDLSTMATSAPYMHSLHCSSSIVPMWEDVFVHGPAPCRMN